VNILTQLLMNCYKLPRDTNLEPVFFKGINNWLTICYPIRPSLYQRLCQSLAPAGGEGKQTEIATTEIPSYRNLPQSCFKIRLYHTGEKPMFLFNLE